MMKTRLLALLLSLLMLVSAFPSGLAQTTASKEETYKATVEELEAYLESMEDDGMALAGMLEIFEDLKGYQQSRSFSHYVTILLMVTEGEFGWDLDVEKSLLESDVTFQQYLEKTYEFSSIGTVQNLLDYTAARELENKKDAVAAMECYYKCLNYFDAEDRYTQLQNKEYSGKYVRAVELLNKRDFAGAYMIFSEMPRYEESAAYMKMIRDTLGYTPASSTDNPKPVTGLKVTKSTHQAITLSWTASSHASSYQVKYWNTSKGRNSAKTINANGTSVSITGLQSDTNYSFTVAAVCGKVVTAETSISGRTAVPATAPTGLKSSGVTQNSITITWNRVANADSYRYAYRKHGSTGWNGWYSAGGTNKATITGLNSDTAYDFKVVAVADGFTSGESTLSNVKTAKAAPNPVSGLKVSSKTSNSVTITWNTVSGASYKYAWRKNGSGSWSGWFTVYSNKVTVSGLKADTAYDFKVVSVANGVTAKSETPLSNVRTSKAAPAAVSGLKASQKTSNSITVTWNKVSGASSYKICWKLHSSSSWNSWKSTSNTSYSITGLKSGTSYDIKVMVVGTNGLTSSQKTLNASTSSAPAPSAVTGLKASATGNTYITLSWTASKNASLYRVYYRRTCDTSWTTAGSTSKTSYKVSGLRTGVRYDFKVVAEGNGKTSSDTLLKNKKTKADSFQDGKLKASSVKTTAAYRFKDASGNVKEVSSFSASAMKSNMKNKNYGYGVRFTYSLPSLAKNRSYTERVEMIAPNGFQMTVYEGTSNFQNVGSKISWYWPIIGTWFFDCLLYRYDKIPTGTYTIALYWDEMLVGYSTFKVK